MWGVASFLLFSATLCHTTTCCAQTPYNIAYDACAFARALGNTPDTIRLNMQREMEYYLIDEDGKWTETMTEDILEFGIFTFSHNNDLASGTAVAGENYWDGFTICTSGDADDYAPLGSTSQSWVDHQWGCMAGGGIDSTGRVVKGAPYLVGYWGMSSGKKPVTSVTFNDHQSHRVLGVWVCNHPWPYYGCLHGDGFSTAFAENGEYFRMQIHGLDALGNETGEAIEVSLVELRGDSVYAPTDWRYIDLSSLGQVYGIYYTLTSTDVSSNMGINTAAYFCMGGIEVLEHVDEIERPVGLVAEGRSETTIQLSWQSVEGASSYRVYVDGQFFGTTTECQCLVTGLKAYTEYKLSVAAVAAAGNESDKGFVNAKTLDTTAPSAPTNLKAVAARFSVDLTWDAATDNVGVEKYVVYCNGVREARPKKTKYTVSGLAQNTEYVFAVEAMDASGNVSERTEITIRTLGDTATDIVEIYEDSNDVKPSATKIFYRGQIVICRGEHIYTINGQIIK